MRDARVTVLPLQTISADGTYYGSTLNLLADYAGNSHIYGTSLYGLPVECIVKNVVTATGDGFTITFSFQVGDDGNSWDEHEEFQTITVDTDGKFLNQNDSNSVSTLTRAKANGRLKTARGYGRVKIVVSGISNGETFDVSGFLSDGTNPMNDGKFR